MERFSSFLNSEELTINSSGKEIKIGAIGKDGQPTKIYSDKGDGSYSSTENGLLWKSYDKDGKLVAGSEKEEKIVLDLTAALLLTFLVPIGNRQLPKRILMVAQESLKL